MDTFYHPRSLWMDTFYHPRSLWMGTFYHPQILVLSPTLGLVLSPTLEDTFLRWDKDL